MMIELPDTIPVFPLSGALLLPRAQLPLHIFEPRYLQMIEDCLKTSERIIGMVQPLVTPRGEQTIHAIGCAGRLTQFSETEDGRYMVTLTGVSRFRVLQEVAGFTPYIRAKTSWVGFEQDLDGVEKDNGFARDDFFDLLSRYLSAKDLQTNWDSLKDTEDELLINSLSMLCPFDSEERQALLEAPSLRTRRETMVMLMEFTLRGGQSDETLQ